jgi:hypothetical protein
MPKCPSCAREVAEDAAFCGYCGAAIGGPDPGIAEPYAGMHPGPSYWICPQCHVENVVDTQRCRACGASQAAPAVAATVHIPPPVAVPVRWRCTNCSELNDADARFCYYCGVPAGAAAPPITAASVPPSHTPGGPAGGQGYHPGASAPPPAARSWGGWLVLVAALIAVAAVGAAVAFVLLQGGSHASNTGSTGVVTTSPPQTSNGGGGSTGSSTGGDTGAEMKTFLNDVKPLMVLSGSGMEGLGHATAPNHPAPGAPDAIQNVIDNRTEVKQRLGSLTVPDDFDARACQSAFKKAMTYALQADRHYLDWANGWGSKSAATSDNVAALHWKTEFVSIYNRLAAQYGLPHDWQPTDI